MDKALITFGCSWTIGVGAGYGKEYYPNNDNEYKTKAWEDLLNSPYAYRSLLCKKYNLENINFSMAGCSNQSQFRLAEEFFASDKFNSIQEKYTGGIFVLWAITSTARTEVYDSVLGRMTTLFYSSYKIKKSNDISLQLSSIMGTRYYNLEHEVKILNNRMKHWNLYFKTLGIKNIWVDTFNHHRYLNPVDNLCFKTDMPRDLLSKMTEIYDSKSYHNSDWKDDCVQIKPGINLGLLNPYSLHPTSKGHEVIAEILSPEIEKLIGY